MILAHGPLGYLLGTLLVWREHAKHGVNSLTQRQKRLLLWTAFFGGIFPDLDLLYYYPFDHQGGSHREYFTHSPYATLVFSAALGCILFCAWRFALHRVHRVRKHRAAHASSRTTQASSHATDALQTIVKQWPGRLYVYVWLACVGCIQVDNYTVLRLRIHFSISTGF